MLVTLVGAGSFDFNGPLLRALLPVAARRNLTIGLCDVDPAALDEMAGIAGRLAGELGIGVPVERFSRLEEAVAEAAFVTLTLNHGGLRGDLGDYQNALDHGYLPKHVDTIGPAGWLRALRMGAFANRLLDAMPSQAMLLNFSNPLSLIVRMAHRRGQPVMGFCHGAFNRRTRFVQWLGLTAQPHIAVWGTNHLTYITEFRQGEEDLYPRLVEFLQSEAAPRGWRFNLELHDRYGTMPVLEAQHMADFFPGFNDYETLAAYGLDLWDGARREASDRAARRHAFATGERPISELHASGEGAEQVIDALLGGPPHRGIYNLPLPEAANGLPAGAIAEGWVTVDQAGCRLDPAPQLPEPIATHLARLAQQQDLAAEGCETGDLEKLLGALLLEPNVRDEASARSLLGRALAERPELFPESWRLVTA